MIEQIVQAFKPSNAKKDWYCGADQEGWYYEQQTRFYDTGCQELKAYCPGTGHSRDVGKEPYYNLATKEIVAPPRVYITHHPQKGEWEHLKTIDDIRKSPLYVRDAT